MSYESLNDALIDAVRAIGGSKQVGPLLWPAMAPDQAQRKLLDALNPERPHRLCPDQVFYVLRLAGDRGHHASMAYACAQAGYAAPTPLPKADDRAELQRKLDAAMLMMADLAKQMQLAGVAVAKQH